MKLADAIREVKRESFGLGMIAYGKLDPHSKYFFDNCCHVAGGKCVRCRAPDCNNRNWRQKGRDLP